MNNNLIGQQVAQIRFSVRGSAVRLIFSNTYDELSELAINGAVELVQGEEKTLFMGAIPGKTYNPRKLEPLVQLLGSRVVSVDSENGLSAQYAWEKARILVLRFDNAMALHIINDCEYDSWELRSGKGIISWL